MCGNEIHKCMCNEYGEGAVMSQLRVYKWFRLFNMGRMETQDKEHLDHPSDSVNNETIAIVQALLSDNRWLTVTNIFNEIAAHYSYVNVSQTSVYCILRKEHD